MAYRELELVSGAVLASTVDVLAVPDPARLSAFEEVMAEMSAAAVSAYRDLVYGDPELVRFFEQATPLSEISRLQIGSRPARRHETRRIEDLRAIPWVFAWTQSRFLLPGWYGVGPGSSEAGKLLAREFLQAMDQEWPFFAATIANAEMALAKSDLDIAERYAGLVDDPELRDSNLGAESRSSIERATREILRLTGQDRLLDREPVLRRSIDRRNPYVDPDLICSGGAAAPPARRAPVRTRRCARSCARSTESPAVSRAPVSAEQKQPRDRAIPRSTCVSVTFPSHYGPVPALPTGGLPKAATAPRRWTPPAEAD